MKHHINNRGKYGWVSGCVLYADSTTSADMDLTGYAYNEYLAAVKAKPTVGHMVYSNKSLLWVGEVQAAAVKGGTVTLREQGATAEECAVALFAAKATHEAGVAALKANPAAMLEWCLKHHDWYYSYSDDHSVWSAGEASLAEIGRLLKKVPADNVEALWKTYAPAEFSLPTL